MKSINQLVRRNILNLEAYSSARDEFSGDNAIFLDANENPYGNLNRYPDSYQFALKTVLSNLKNIPKENIFVGNGSDEAIDLLFRIFCEPREDQCLIFTPTYGMYEVAAAINGIETIKSETSDSFDLSFSDLEAKINPNLKLIFICSPNNPTGNNITTSKILEILSIYQGILVIDEAYIDFSEEESRISLLKKYPNLVILQTMSKAWGLASARIGFAFASKEIINLFNRVKPPYNISSLNESAAIKALKNSSDFNTQKEEIIRNRATMFEQLSQLRFVNKIYPSVTNFLLVEVENANFIYDKLVEQKIIVRNRSSIVRNCLRITVGSTEENTLLINFLKQLENEKSTIY